MQRLSIRQVKTIVNASIDAIRKRQDSPIKYDTNFAFQLDRPFEGKSDSETLSNLDKLLGAVSKFDENLMIGFALGINVASDETAAISKEVNDAFNASEELRRNIPTLDIK